MIDPFKEALDRLEFADNGNPDKLSSVNYREYRDEKLNEWVEVSMVTIRKALRIASRLHQEPTESMTRRTMLNHDAMRIAYKAMTHQLMKECEDAS